MHHKFKPTPVQPKILSADTEAARRMRQKIAEKNLADAKENPSAVIYARIKANNPSFEIPSEDIPTIIKNSGDILREYRIKPLDTQKKVGVFHSNLSTLINCIDNITFQYINLPEHQYFNQFFQVHGENSYNAITNRDLPIDEQIHLVAFAAAYKYQGEAATVLANFYSTDKIASHAPDLFRNPAKMAELIGIHNKYTKISSDGKLVSDSFSPKITLPPEELTQKAPAVASETNGLSIAPQQVINSEQYVKEGTRLYAQGNLEEGKKTFVKALEKARADGKKEQNAPALFGLIYYHTATGHPEKIGKNVNIRELEKNFLPKQKKLWEALKAKSLFSEAAKDSSQNPAVVGSITSPVITQNPEDVSTQKPASSITSNAKDAAISTMNLSSASNEPEEGWIIASKARTKGATKNVVKEEKPSGSKPFIQPQIEAQVISIIPIQTPSDTKKQKADQEKISIIVAPEVAPEFKDTDFPALTRGLTTANTDKKKGKKKKIETVIPQNTTANLHTDKPPVENTSAFIAASNIGSSAAIVDITSHKLTFSPVATEESLKHKHVVTHSQHSENPGSVVPQTNMGIPYQYPLAAQPFTPYHPFQYMMPYLFMMPNQFFHHNYDLTMLPPVLSEGLEHNHRFLESAKSLVSSGLLTTEETDFFNSRILTKSFTEENASNAEWNLLVKLASPDQNKQKTDFAKKYIIPRIEKMHRNARSGILDNQAKIIYERCSNIKQI